MNFIDPITGPYVLVIGLLAFLLYSIYIYRKGYKRGKFVTNKTWMEIFKNVADEKGIPFSSIISDKKIQEIEEEDSIE